MIAAYRNGVRVDGFALDSRAAHYGDGAFTTLRIHAGCVCWWVRSSRYPMQRKRTAWAKAAKRAAR